MDQFFVGKTSQGYLRKRFIAKWKAKLSHMPPPSEESLSPEHGAQQKLERGAMNIDREKGRKREDARQREKELVKEKLEKDTKRKEKERQEQEEARQRREEAERVRREKERLAKQEKERADRERKEQEKEKELARQKEEEKKKKEALEMERREKEERQRAEERRRQEALAKLEQERLEKEQKEKESARQKAEEAKKKQEERERREKEKELARQKEAEAKRKQETQERERREKEELLKQEQERRNKQLEAEKQEKLKRDQETKKQAELKAERERKEKEEKERLDREAEKRQRDEEERARQIMEEENKKKQEENERRLAEEVAQEQQRAERQQREEEEQKREKAKANESQEKGVKEYVQSVDKETREPEAQQREAGGTVEANPQTPLLQAAGERFSLFRNSSERNKPLQLKLRRKDSIDKPEEREETHKSASAQSEVDEVINRLLYGGGQSTTDASSPTKDEDVPKLTDSDEQARRVLAKIQIEKELASAKSEADTTAAEAQSSQNPLDTSRIIDDDKEGISDFSQPVNEEEEDEELGASQFSISEGWGELGSQILSQVGERDSPLSSQFDPSQSATQAPKVRHPSQGGSPLLSPITGSPTFDDDDGPSISSADVLEIGATQKILLTPTRESAEEWIAGTPLPRVLEITPEG